MQAQSRPVGEEYSDDRHRLIHELQVHQIELEMQNEELKSARVELEEALRRYSDLYDFAPVGYLSLDAGGTIRNANLTAARLLVIDRAQLIGKPFGRFVSDSDRPLILGLLRTLAAGATESVEAELRTEARVAVYAGLLLSASDDGLEFRLALMDLGERRRLEEHLRMAQRMEAVGLLAGGVAHDFNNLLTAILGFSGFALRALPEGSAGRSDVLAIKMAGERAAVLTKQLLAFSNRQVPDPELIDLSRIVDGVSKMLQSVLGEQTRLEVRLAEDLWSVMANPAQMEQVLMNLALNSRDAMPHGGRFVVETSNVRFGQDDARRLAMTPGPYVMMVVTDTGLGMDASTRSRVFEPFFTTKKKGQGSGLGLTIVHGIVKQSRGHIWVSSEPGKGTTFQIYLPGEERVAVAAHETATKSIPPSTGTETVLVVEDEDALREVEQRILQDAGFTVLCAASGAEALRIYEANRDRIQLVLTDVIMPEMTGPALATQLASTYPDVKVLFMSGYTGMASGEIKPGEQFIAKPFGPSQLTRKVRDVLDKSGNGRGRG